MLLRKHFIKCPLGFKVHIPSTKTHQLYFQFHTIFIPFIKNSSLCPVTALTTMFHMYPTSPDSPAFVVPRGGRYVPLLAFAVRQTLAKIIMALQLQPSAFTFHAFRRSGATFSFHNNVAFEDIRLQGSFKSDAIIHTCNPPMLHTRLLHPFKLYYKIYNFYIWAWALNPLFLPSCYVLLNNITKITNKCLVVINGPIYNFSFS